MERARDYPFDPYSNQRTRKTRNYWTRKRLSRQRENSSNFKLSLSLAVQSRADRKQLKHRQGRLSSDVCTEPHSPGPAEQGRKTCAKTGVGKDARNDFCYNYWWGQNISHTFRSVIWRFINCFPSI